jgi:hypothetical protein
MTPISIQNSLQNSHLDVDSRYVSEAYSNYDQTAVLGSSRSHHQLEEQSIISYLDSSHQDSEDQTVIQDSDESHPQLEEQTVIQYSDSAIYSPAEQTALQSFAPPFDLEEQTVCQKDIPYTSQTAPDTEQKHNVQKNIPQSDTLQIRKSFTERFSHLVNQLLSSIRRITNVKQKRSKSTQQLPAANALSTTDPIRRQTYNETADDQLSLEQYQRVLWELDQYRLSFAKEVARNGKFRDAIAIARQIPESSRFFRDARTLISTWKQF